MPELVIVASSPGTISSHAPRPSLGEALAGASTASWPWEPTAPPEEGIQSGGTSLRDAITQTAKTTSPRDSLSAARDPSPHEDEAWDSSGEMQELPTEATATNKDAPSSYGGGGDDLHSAADWRDPCGTRIHPPYSEGSSPEGMGDADAAGPPMLNGTDVDTCGSGEAAAVSEDGGFRPALNAQSSSSDAGNGSWTSAPLQLHAEEQMLSSPLHAEGRSSSPRYASSPEACNGGGLFSSLPPSRMSPDPDPDPDCDGEATNAGSSIGGTRSDRYAPSSSADGAPSSPLQSDQQPEEEVMIPAPSRQRSLSYPPAGYDIAPLLPQLPDTAADGLPPPDSERPPTMGGYDKTAFAPLAEDPTMLPPLPPSPEEGKAEPRGSLEGESRSPIPDRIPNYSPSGFLGDRPHVYTSDYHLMYKRSTSVPHQILSNLTPAMFPCPPQATAHLCCRWGHPYRRYSQLTGRLRPRPQL